MKLFKFIVVGVMSFVLLGMVSMAQAQPDNNNVIWNSTYYNNSYLGEPSVLTRRDASLSFDWRSGSPANVINEDFFSVRSTTSAFFNSDFYRFRVVADDGVRVTIDNTITLIDTFNDPQPNESFIADVDMSAGRHTIQVDYREVQGLALLNIGWIPINNPGETISIPPRNTSNPTIPFPPISPASNWEAHYYANPDLLGTPSAIVTETSPSHDWGTGAPFSTLPTDNFSAEWTGTFFLDGTYEITVRADDGVRVFVDGVNYINEWHPATAQTYTARFSVLRGNHTIVIQYYEAGGIAFLDYDLMAVRGNIPPTTLPDFDPNLGWLVQYYDNAGLAGTPVLTQTEDRVSRTWGFGSPLPSILNDNFSVRFTSTQSLTAGNYLLRVRADDGVRVYIDGITLIDEWHISDGSQTYTQTVNLTGGNHTITIEYYENTRNAFIEYSLDRTDTGIVPDTDINGATRATVTASLLNVRGEPNAFAPILTKIRRGETYPIVGQNAAGTWIQLNINGLVGWVNETFTDEFNFVNVPITDNVVIDVPDFAGYTLTTTANLNMRSGPGLENSIIRIIPDGTTVDIEARTIDSDWWQVRYRGTLGWVTEAFINLSPNVNVADISVFN